MNNPWSSEAQTLDPQDWEPMRALGYRMVDDVIRLHASLHDEPVWQKPNAAPFSGAAPRGRRAPESVYDEVARDILPYHYGNIHARGWGWVNGVGTTVGAFADMMAAAMSPNVWGGNHASVLVEAQVLGWFARALGFPADATGLLVSGGSVANLVALAAARERHAGTDVFSDGIQGTQQLTVYASAEVHNSVDKAVATLGIGTRHLRRIACDTDYRMDVNALRSAIEQDLAAGMRPIAVVATAGTVNTGSFDPISAIADLCAELGIWLHVDGAFGSMVALTPEYAPLAKGLERADSVAFDFHKWLHIPVDCGCVITRSGAEQKHAFSPHAHYLARFERGVASGDLDFSARGLQLTRSFRALKVWMTMQTYGIDTMGQLVAQNVQQAAWLAEQVSACAELELLAPVPLNIVCFRYVKEGVEGEQLNGLNRELLMRVQESGLAVVSSTLLQGRFALRCCICNHRTQQSDLQALLDGVLRIGRSL